MTSREGGECITPRPTPSHGRQTVGLAVTCSCSWGLLTCTPSTRATSTVLPSTGAGSILLNAAASKGQGQLTCSHDPRGQISLLPQAVGKDITSACATPCEKWLGSAFPHSHPKEWFTHPAAIKASSTALPGKGTRSSLLNVVSGERWGQLFGALYSVRDGASYAQPLDILVVPRDCPDWGHPHIL